jgi:cell division protein FtsA
MAKSEILVGLDIGTTKICALVGRKDSNGKIEILGVGKADSHGVKRGMVANIEKTVASIKKAVQEASDKSGVEIESVHVGIAGQHIGSLQQRGILTRHNIEDEISKYDVQKLIDDMHKLSLPPGEEIIHVLPQDFIVDNEPDIKEPIGMSGNRLEAKFHIITGQVTAIKNIFRCVEKAGLNVSDLILEPIASSAAVLTEEEKEAGVALVDIGGGTTDIAIFYDGIIRHTAVIPFGGNSISNDIKEGCLVLDAQAEALKVKYGTALPTERDKQQVICIPVLRGRSSTKEISTYNLGKIINARVEEILEQVMYEIKRSGFERKLTGGIVVTGGGALMKHLVQLVEYKTGYIAKIGLPTEYIVKNNVGDFRNPIYSTGIGLLIKGFEDNEYKRSLNILKPKQEINQDTELPQEELKKEVKPIEKQGKSFGSILSINSWKNKLNEFFTDDEEIFKNK